MKLYNGQFSKNEKEKRKVNGEFFFNFLQSKLKHFGANELPLILFWFS